MKENAHQHQPGDHTGEFKSGDLNLDSYHIERIHPIWIILLSGLCGIKKSLRSTRVAPAKVINVPFGVLEARHEIRSAKTSQALNKAHLIVHEIQVAPEWGARKPHRNANMLLPNSVPKLNHTVCHQPCV